MSTSKPKTQPRKRYIAPKLRKLDPRCGHDVFSQSGMLTPLTRIEHVADCSCEHAAPIAPSRECSKPLDDGLRCIRAKGHKMGCSPVVFKGES